MAVSVGVVGAAGFAGAELVRILAAHPAFDLVAMTSDALAGTPVAEAYPALSALDGLVFSPNGADALAGCDAVFLAVPHTASLAQTPALLRAGISVFDLSADYRLKDPEIYRSWYGTAHTSPELLSQAAFGLPELFRDDLGLAARAQAAGEAVLVACAGCYPTAASLAAAPALAAGLATAPVVVDAVSGITGAGKQASARTHFCSANENVEAYSAGAHRHTPEIEQILGLPGKVAFTPHLAPLSRGLLATVYLPLAADRDRDGLAAIQAHYEAFYGQDRFVEVLCTGVLPKTASVRGTNRCQIGLALAAGTDMLIAVGAIDNLCKGAAGQAIQCANIVFGLDEGCGVPFLSLPV